MNDMSDTSEVNGHREHLENRAAEVRARLEKKLSLIEERRHHVADVVRSALRPPASVIILGAVGVVASLFFLRSRARRARAAPLSSLLLQLLPPPPLREKSFLVQGLERAAASFVIGAVQRIGKRSLDQLLAEAPPEPRAL
jgi:hypothetical protein